MYYVRTYKINIIKEQLKKIVPRRRGRFCRLSLPILLPPIYEHAPIKVFSRVDFLAVPVTTQKQQSEL